ncbi:MAG: FecR domain-containing protein [Bacteroidales bacterium]|nr:FecR domain-containing protein [Bacteroidales bacterium]
MNTDKGIHEELLYSYINGYATDAQIEEVMQWARENPENMKELETLRRLNDESIWNTGIDMEKSHGQVRKSALRRFALWSMAASVVLLAGFSLSLLFFGKARHNAPISVHAPLGQRTELTLADGTLVWLNSGSRLDVDEGFNRDVREVNLDGEAYFSVTENAEKPFVVRTKSYSVKVLGTEFNVSSYSNVPEWSVSLVKGKVEIFGGNDVNVILSPNMKAEEIGGKLVTSEFSDYDALLWRKGILSFEDASFSDIFSKLETYYQVSFKVEDSEILERHSTCKFMTSDGIDCIMDILLMGENLSYEFDIDERVIRVR